MTKVNQFKKGSTFLGLVTTFFMFGANLIVFPFIVRYLSVNEYSAWVLFVSTAAIIEVLDFSFNINLSRYFSYLCNDDNKLLYKHGESGEFITTSLEEMFGFAKKIYFFISLTGGLIFLVCFSVYLYFIFSKNHVYLSYFMGAWILFCIASFINLFFTYYVPVIYGVGKVNTANKIQLLNKIINVIVTITTIKFLGLYSISFAVLLSVIIERIYFSKVIKESGIVVVKVSWERFCAIFSIVWYNVFRGGINVVATFILNRLQLLTLPAFFSLSVIAPYLLTMQLFTILMSVAHTPMVIKFNEICYYQKNDSRVAVHIFLTANARSMAIFLVGGIILFLFGNELLQVISNNKNLVSRWFLCIFFIVYWCEKHLLNHCTMIATLNKNPAYLFLVISSILSYLGGVILLYLNYGWMSFLISQFSFQLFNYVYWVNYNLNMCKIKKTKYLLSLVKIL